MKIISGTIEKLFAHETPIDLRGDRHQALNALDNGSDCWSWHVSKGGHSEKSENVADACKCPTTGRWCSGRLPEHLDPTDCLHCGEMATQADTTSQQQDFEQTGNPVACPYWRQVCQSVGYYQKQCSRSTDCRIYQFLKLPVLP